MIENINLQLSHRPKIMGRYLCQTRSMGVVKEKSHRCGADLWDFSLSAMGDVHEW